MRGSFIPYIIKQTANVDEVVNYALLESTFGEQLSEVNIWFSLRASLNTCKHETYHFLKTITTNQHQIPISGNIT